MPDGRSELPVGEKEDGHGTVKAGASGARAEAEAEAEGGGDAETRRHPSDSDRSAAIIDSSFRGQATPGADAVTHETNKYTMPSAI